MLIAGNWKMFKGPAESGDFCRALRDTDLPDGVDVVVCPPFVSLAAAAQALAGTEIGVFAQNCHWEPQGAFTGEVSAAMLLELGVYGTLVGHSERRQYFGETDETVGRRVRAALDAGLHVIACVGETEAERDAGETEAVLRRQLSVLRGRRQPRDRLRAGVGDRHRPFGHAGDGPGGARESCARVVDVPVLYGGSVKPENAEAVLSQPAVDGALVGGAALDLDSFAAICRAAVTSRS